VARGQARLFGVAGSNPPGSVRTSLSDSSVSVSLIQACGVITPYIIGDIAISPIMGDIAISPIMGDIAISPIMGDSYLAYNG
jgi:hypothetical protein